MGIYIEYENICLNCKEKGFYFGFSYKTIEFDGEKVLDLPARHLNGPCLMFNYLENPLLIHSLENSHQMDADPEKPVFAMINMKRGQNTSKYTYQYILNNNNNLVYRASKPTESNPKILFFVDTYRYANKPYILTFYGFKNLTGEPLKQFNFYKFLDFDIYGQAGYNKNSVKYNKELDVIYQYHSEKGLEKGLIAGITSTTAARSTHYEGNKSLDLMISIDRYNLRDIGEWGPDDCAVGLQWEVPDLKPNQTRIFPIVLVMGFGLDVFTQSAIEAKAHLSKLIPKFQQSISESSRLEIDPKLEKMAFSVTQWCKSAH